MPTAQIAKLKIHKHSAVLAVLTLAAALATPTGAIAAAGAPQICEPSQTCAVGEFLYDDSYSPITSASCTFTSRDPSGTIVHNGSAMTANSDGYYSLSFTAESTEGVYRAQICCTAGTDYLCLDKTYEVKVDSSSTSPDDVASAVWSYSNRTLSTFGTLVTDIWSSSSRTLTNLITGTSSTDSSTSTSTDSSTSTSTDSSIVNLSTIQNQVNDNRLILEQLVNEPIIETFLEEEEDIDLSEKLKNSSSMASHVYANYQFVRSKTDRLVSKWDSTSEVQVIDEVLALAELMGDESDSSTETIFGQINWVKDSWDWDITDELYEQTKLNSKALMAVQTHLGSHGKTKYSLLQLRSLLSYMDSMEGLVGDVSDDSRSFSLFGKIREIEEIAQALDAQDEEATKLLVKLEEGSDVYVDIEKLVRKVIAINKLPKISTVYSGIDMSKPVDTINKNKLLASKGVIRANRKLLARGAGKSFGVTWLEEGSFIFKSIITNPSKLIAQEAHLKYFLPPEVREEHVMSKDDGVEVKYDTDTGKYYVEGKFNLETEETITVSIKIDNIFLITDEQVQSLKTQAEELAKPLEDTAFFAQGVTLTSDINASLDKVLALQKKAVTPEEKIRAYREAAIELTYVDEKISKLQDLVTQASSSGSLKAFVGGAQTLAVWGLIIVMITGFVFLVIYMRTLGVKDTTLKKKKSKKDKGSDIEVGGSGSAIGFNYGGMFRAAMPFVLVGIMSASVGGVVAGVVMKPEEAKIVEERDEKVAEAPAPEEQEEVLGESEEKTKAPIGGEEIVKIVVPAKSKVNIRKEPTTDSEIVYEFNETSEVVKIGEFKNWVNIIFENEDISVTTEKDVEDLVIDAWVHSDYVETEEGSAEEENELGYSDQYYIDEFNRSIGGRQYVSDNGRSTSTVTVTETPTGWLRVRSEPWGEEIMRAYPGDEFKLIAEVGDWYEVELQDSTSGFVYEGHVVVE